MEQLFVDTKCTKIEYRDLKSTSGGTWFHFIKVSFRTILKLLPFMTRLALIAIATKYDAGNIKSEHFSMIGFTTWEF